MRIISGKYKRRKLLSPKDILTRPSTDRLRETLMGVLEGGRLGHPLKSKIILDVFSGTGALGIEASSRGNPEKVIFIENNILPPTLNYRSPDPECDLDYVPNSARPREIRNAISTSVGLGGHNSAMIFSQWAG